MTAETSNARGEWALVPREPTKEMEHEGIGVAEWTGDVKVIWSAMLAAAPPPVEDARGELRMTAETSNARGEWLPDRDESKAATEQGLFRKFEVRRTDGSDAPGGKHDGCEYFVLDMTHDPHAKAAAAAYAASVAETHPQLAADMSVRYGITPPPAAEGEICETDLRGAAVTQAGEVEQLARELLAHFGETDLRSGERAIGHSGPESGEWETYIEVSVETLARIAAALSQQPEAQGVVDELRRTVAAIGVVGEYLGRDTILRESVLDLIDRRLTALTEARNVR